MHVTLRLYTLPEYPNDPLQGNAAIVYLTVYGELNSFSN